MQGKKDEKGEDWIVYQEEWKAKVMKCSKKVGSYPSYSKSTKMQVEALHDGHSETNTRLTSNQIEVFISQALPD